MTQPATRDAVRTLAATWVLLVLGVTGLGWLLTHPLEGAVDPWDDDVELWLEARRTPELDVTAAMGSHVADTVVGLALAFILALAFRRWWGSWRPAVYYAVLVGPMLALYLIVTALVPRDRPPVEILDPGLVPDHSYPSGHLVTAIVVYCGTALVLRAYVPRWRRRTWPLFLVPVAVAPSRLYEGAHHPTDVLASLVFASVWLLVVVRVLLPREALEPQEPREPVRPVRS